MLTKLNHIYSKELVIYLLGYLYVTDGVYKENPVDQE